MAGPAGASCSYGCAPVTFTSEVIVMRSRLAAFLFCTVLWVGASAAQDRAASGVLLEAAPAAPSHSIATVRTTTTRAATDTTTLGAAQGRAPYPDAASPVVSTNQRAREERREKMRHHQNEAKQRQAELANREGEPSALRSFLESLFGVESGAALTGKVETHGGALDEDPERFESIASSNAAATRASTIITDEVRPPDGVRNVEQSASEALRERLSEEQERLKRQAADMGDDPMAKSMINGMVGGVEFESNGPVVQGTADPTATVARNSRANPTLICRGGDMLVWNEPYETEWPYTNGRARVRTFAFQLNTKPIGANGAGLKHSECAFAQVTDLPAGYIPPAIRFAEDGPVTGSSIKADLASSARYWAFQVVQNGGAWDARSIRRVGPAPALPRR
jgi:hypothetical protein